MRARTACRRSTSSSSDHSPPESRQPTTNSSQSNANRNPSPAPPTPPVAQERRSPTPRLLLRSNYSALPSQTGGTPRTTNWPGSSPSSAPRTCCDLRWPRGPAEPPQSRPAYNGKQKPGARAGARRPISSAPSWPSSTKSSWARAARAHSRGHHTAKPLQLDQAWATRRRA